MSATLDEELFATHFQNVGPDGELSNAPSLSVPGRTFPVEEKYLEDVLKDGKGKVKDHVSLVNLVENEVRNIVENIIRLMLELLEDDTGCDKSDAAVSGVGNGSFVSDMETNTIFQRMASFVSHTTGHRRCCNPSRLCADDVAIGTLSAATPFLEDEVRNLGRLSAAGCADEDAVHVAVHEIHQLASIGSHGKSSPGLEDGGRYPVLISLVGLREALRMSLLRV